MFQPSPEQSSIFSAVSRSENICVDAKAGTGKTTTIENAIRFVPRDPDAVLSPSIILLAFNKSIVDTMKARIPPPAIISTFHSLGFRALKDNNLVERSVKVDGSKVRKILWNLLDQDNEDFRSILRLVALLKSQIGITPFDEINPSDLIEHHGLDFLEPEQSIHYALMALKRSNADLKTIDFDDMLYLPILLNASFSKYDWIFVDEAQDLNLIQHEIIARMFQPIPNRMGMSETLSATRLCAVGDPNQAIYGFRGADSDSMSVLARRFSCKTYPLSVSYRCPRNVVTEACKYL